MYNITITQKLIIKMQAGKVLWKLNIDTHLPYVGRCEEFLFPHWPSLFALLTTFKMLL